MKMVGSELEVRFNKIYSDRSFDISMKQLFNQLTGVDANEWNYSSSSGSYGYVAHLAIDKNEANSKAVEAYLSNIQYPSEFSDITYEWRYDYYNQHWDCVISMERNKDAQTREYDRFIRTL